MKNKKAAGHVDWTVSIGIFLIFLLTILVFIKPVYKPHYESKELGEIIKEPFLEQNSRIINRTLVNNQQISGCNGYLEADIGNLGDYVYVTDANFEETDRYFKKDSTSLLFNNQNGNYWVYSNLESDESNTGTLDFSGSNDCGNSRVGEAIKYSGLKSTSIRSFDRPENFPDTKEFNIKIRNVNTGEILDSSGEEPPEGIEVSVYEFIYPILDFQKTSDYIKKENVLISFQIW